MSPARAAVAYVALALLAAAGSLKAEPYLAVEKGMKCSTCHVSATGGGMRTRYGNVYAQTEFVARKLGDGSPWTGEIGRYLGLGGDLRWGRDWQDVPGQPTEAVTELDELLAYAELRVFPGYLSLYVDAKLRPDDPVVREQYARLTFPGGRWWLRAGEFFLPYGYRLQDDEAFVRQVGGINYNTPDTGVEAGYEGGPWTAQLAVTRGTAGGPEVDSGKQYSLRAAYVTSGWRVGGSFNFNDADAGDRQMQNVFAGLKTGPVAWLAEIDYIIDDGFAPRRKFWVTLIEANYRYRQGHNLKLTAEWHDPDAAVDEDERTRLSAVWEYAPVQFVQARIGFRDYDGIPQNAAQNVAQYFAEIHLSW
ncbi:MAG TPA: hypothetical protein VFY03_05625 [Woeseiaceae bacterium]|nr:hypothetical protein [Woeseiaceae bacterium]